MGNRLPAIIHSPFTWALVALLLVELVLRGTLFSPDDGNDQSLLRNNTPYRGWPEYVDAVGAQRPVILVGNSQGIGLEFPDAGEIYAASLDQRLRAANSSISLANWSVLGLGAHQVDILSRRALTSGPTALVLVVSLTNFTAAGATTLSRDATDIPLLLASSPMTFRWWELPAVSAADTDTLLPLAFRATTAIGRSRTAWQDALATRVPMRSHRLLFGRYHPRKARVPLDSPGAREFPRIERPLQVQMDEARWRAQFEGEHYPEALAFYDRLRVWLATTDTPLVWAWMPHDTRGGQGAAVAAMVPLQQAICERVFADGHTCIDLAHEMPTAGFYRVDYNSHLSREGHRLMADLLAPVILDAIH